MGTQAAGGQLPAPSRAAAAPANPRRRAACRRRSQRLLKNDRIPYGVLPVTRYEEITEDFFRYYRPEETVRLARESVCSLVAVVGWWWWWE